MTSTPIRCGFCGSELEPARMTLDIAGVEREVTIGHRECDCDQAAAKRARDRAREAAGAAKRAAAERRERFGKAGIPPKYLEADADVSQGLSRILAGRGLYIQGDNGTLKTTYASALAKKVIEHGRTAVFTSSSRMKGELFSTSRDRTEEDLFRKWSSPYLLVIDDLGKECGSKAVVSMLYRVVNERDEQMRPVVVTTNFDKKALGEKLAECGDESCAQAIVSRLFGMTDKMVFGGEDRRLA